MRTVFHHINVFGVKVIAMINIFSVVVFAALFNCAERTITNENIHSTVVLDPWILFNTDNFILFDFSYLRLSVSLT